MARIVIIGGGTAGLAVAARLRRAGQSDITIIEPSARHFYQPLWTLVGGGTVAREATVRPEARYMPQGVRWIRDSVAELAPERRSVTTAGGSTIDYDFLVVASGLEMDYEKIPGLREALAGEGVSTNYSYDLAPKTWRAISSFRGGVALFHMPGTPIKCPGAPQKIMYLAADHFRRKGISRDARVIYGSATASIYGVPQFAAVLNGVLERYGIDARFNHELVEIRPEKREAVFRNTKTSDGEQVVIPYDLMHVAPPQRAPEFVRKSALADPEKREGWLKVDKHTLRNPDYPEVFALGDVTNTPNAKTGAAAARQAPVAVENLLAAIAGKEPAARYDGYIACPIVTAYGKMLLCEADYTGKPAPSFPFLDTFRERYDMWLLKRYGLPWAYWNFILRGRSVPFLRAREVAQLAGARAESQYARP